MSNERMILTKWKNADGTEGFSIESTEFAAPVLRDNLKPGGADAVFAAVAVHIESELQRRGFRKADA